MVSIPNLPENPAWRQFLLFGEELLALDSTFAQIEFIKKYVENEFKCTCQVWLLSPSYPLPGEVNLPILPGADASALLSRVISEKRLCCQVAVDNDQECSPELSPHLMAAPLQTQGVMLGIVMADRSSGATFTESEMIAFDGLTSSAAVAMQVWRQMTLKNWRYEQLMLVRQVSSQIARMLELDELFEHVVTLIQNTFDFYYVAIFTLDSSSNVLTFRASASQNSPAQKIPLFSASLHQGIIGEVAATGQEILADDVQKEKSYRHVDALKETRSEFTLPLIVEDRVLGVLDVQSNYPGAFHEIDREVLRALASSIAVAMDGARMWADLQWRSDQIQTIAEVSRVLSSILDQDELLATVVEVIHKRFNYPFVHIFTVQSGRRLIFYKAGSGERSEAFASQDITYDLDAPLGLIPQCARTGQSILVNDVEKDPLFQPSSLPPYNTKSELVLPLKFGTDVIGVLDLQSDQLGAFTQNDLFLLEALAAGIAVAIRNATVYRSEQWRRQVGESFREVASMLSANTALDRLLQAILEELERNLPCDSSAIWLLDEATDAASVQTHTLALAASRGVSPETIVRVRQESTDVRAWLDNAVNTDEPIIRQPSDPIGPLGAACDYPSDYSSIAVPLRAGDLVLGVLTIAHSTTGRYGSEARAMTTTFASYAAVAIQNARLFTRAQEQAWISTVLLQVSDASQSTTSQDELLSTIARITPLMVGVKRCGFLIWEPYRQAYAINAAFGFELDLEDFIFEQDAPALAQLRQNLAANIILDPVAQLGVSLPADAGERMVLFPLIAQNEYLGAFLVAYEDNQGLVEGTQFTNQTLSILQGIAVQTSLALLNNQLMEAKQEDAYVTAVLLQVAQAVVTQNNLDDILDTIIHLLPILVGFDSAAIYLWDENHQVFEPIQAFAEAREDQDTLLEKAFELGEHDLLDNTFTSDAFLAAPLPDGLDAVDRWQDAAALPADMTPSPAQLTSSAWLFGFPLSIKGEKFGVLLTRESVIRPETYERRLDIINGISQQIAIAIQNDRLKEDMVKRERMQREVQLARQIQQTFLPDRPPDLLGWDVEMRWQTAREVGGDFYDFFPVGDDRMAFVVADVADKGMPAALYMTVTRTLIRALAQNEPSPGKVLARVNNLLALDTQNGMFVTSAFGILTLDTGEFVYANAGHNLPIHRHKRSTHFLPQGDMALGVVEDIAYAESRHMLEPDDVLVLYTDGVTESFSNAGEAFGDDRLRETIRKARILDARSILQAIEENLLEFRDGQPPSDDLTILVIHRKPSQ